MDTEVVRVVGLQYHFPGCVPPAGTTSHLGQKLEGALAAPEIGKIEGEVGTDDPHQGDAGEIVALGHHLSAHQHIDIAVAKSFQYFQ